MMTAKKVLYIAGCTLVLFFSPVSVSVHAPTGGEGLYPQAEARTRIDPGLPMTNVPYRYSAYLFMLAITLSNIYKIVKRDRAMRNGETA